MQAADALLLDALRFDVVNIDARSRVNAAVQQRLGQRDVGIAKIDILANHSNVHFALRILLGLDDSLPFAEIGRRQVEAQLSCHDVVKPLLMHHRRYLIQVIDVIGRYHGTLRHVRKQCNLLALFNRQRLF